MILKPQDILVLLKLVAMGKEPWSYNRLAVDLGMSPAETHAAVQRALGAQLAVSLGIYELGWRRGAGDGWTLFAVVLNMAYIWHVLQTEGGPP